MKPKPAPRRRPCPLCGGPAARIVPIMAAGPGTSCVCRGCGFEGPASPIGAHHARRLFDQAARSETKKPTP